MSSRVPTHAGVGSYVLVQDDPTPARVVSYLCGAAHPWLIRLADGSDVWAKPSHLTWLVEGLPAAYSDTLFAELEELGL